MKLSIRFFFLHFHFLSLSVCLFLLFLKMLSILYVCVCTCLFLSVFKWFFLYCRCWHLEWNLSILPRPLPTSNCKSTLFYSKMIVHSWEEKQLISSYLNVYISLMLICLSIRFSNQDFFPFSISLGIRYVSLVMFWFGST